MSFGRNLLRKGLIDQTLFDELTQIMVTFGGRLGTILTEAGHLTVDDVEAHLAASVHVDLGLLAACGVAGF